MTNNIKHIRRVADNDSLYDDIDTVLSSLGDIKVSRFYSEGDSFLTLSSDFDTWRKNSKEIKSEMQNLGYDFNNAGGSGDRVMLDFQKAKVSDSRKIKDAVREVKVYTFDELSEEAKKNAIDNLRYRVAEDLDYFDADDFGETIKEVCEVFNAESYGNELTDLHYRGDDYGEYMDEDGQETAESVRSFVEDRLEWSGISKKAIETDWAFTGVYSDDAACQYIKKVLNGEENPGSIDEFIEVLGDQIGYQWEKQQEYNSGDETVAEQLSANNYEFLEDGTPFN